LRAWLSKDWSGVTIAENTSAHDIYAMARKQAGEQPWLSIVTRHMISRPNLFAQHCQSLLMQTDQDYEHIVIVDDKGQGLNWANGQFAEHAARVRGRYVLTLDDDDIFSVPTAIQELKAQTIDNQADIVFFRAEHAKLSIIPDTMVWQKKPVCGHVGGQDYITRSDLWLQHVRAWQQPLCGDYYFLEALWPHVKHVVWFDKQLVKVLQIGKGLPEH